MVAAAVRSVAASIILFALSTTAVALTAEQRETLRLRDRRMTEVADPAATRLAAELGEANDVEALKEIARLRDYRLLDAYVYPFGRSRGELPAQVEAVLVDLLQMLFDRQLQRAALPLIGRWPECRHTYASRELFDTLRAMQESAADAAALGEFTTHFVCTTARDVDEAMARTIAKSKARDRGLIVQYLIKKRAVGTIRALELAQASIPSKEGDWIHAEIDRAFLEFDTQESIEAFYRRVAWIGRNPTAPGVEHELGSVAPKLANWPPKTPLSYERLRPLLVSVPVTRQTPSMIEMAKRLKDPAAARDLLAFVDGPYGANAIEAIIEVGSPQDWRAASEKIAALPPEHALNDAKYRMLRDRLKSNVSEPDKAVAERDRMNRLQAWRAARSDLEQRLKPPEARRSEPLRFAAEMQAYLASAEKLLGTDASEPEVRAYRGTLAGEYQRLATFTRFTLKDPARAVRLYEHAIAVGAELRHGFYPGLMERMGLADTLRFDLRDNERALAVYRELLSRLQQEPRPRNDAEAAIGNLLVEWVGAEIAFLAEGKRYAGQPSADMVSGVGMMLFFSDGGGGFASDDAEMAALLRAARMKGGLSDEQKREVAATLEGLAPSQARFVWAFQLLPLLGSPERIAAFARRNDPSGFASANAFATLHALGAMLKENPTRLQGEPLFGWSKAEGDAMAAAERAVLGRSVALSMKPDTRLATPEATWRTFVAALRASDFDTMWKCTTPGIRNKFEAAFRGMTPAQRREAADSMEVFARGTEYGPFVEAFVGKKGGHGGIVTFGRRGQDWIISEM